ncbi:MAG: 3-methyl-2-oxobutanoate hydroxymethyltransferase [Bryobacteraceae bacterium]|nr:3-methyl-2-oxobutanoate hydroxymethyltransferase [Bryobacteraceae bacterium]
MPQLSTGIRIPDLAKYKAEGRKITMLTAYDASMAKLLDEAGIDVLLVGDSLGMVIMGHDTTIPVTLEAILHHSRAVAKGATRAVIVADMPFLTYQVSAEEALRNAGRLIQEGGAAAVKIEGGIAAVPAVQRLVAAGIPVMGHVGLTPQFVHGLGGFRAVGKTEDEAQALMRDARALEEAGAFSLVLECIPSRVAEAITRELRIPTIGIGSGPACDGQVLVSYDALGLYPGFTPKFVKRYAELGVELTRAARGYAADVRAGRFPGKTAPAMPELVATVSGMRELTAKARREGRSVGLVPTMGALHEGHGALMDRARGETDFLVVSIFVNPTQFDRQDDYRAYTINLDADIEMCRRHGVDAVFAPSAAEMYKPGARTYVEAPGVSDLLCGQFRPGHFRGVATVVAKLLNIAAPDRAYFGEKDAQQLAVIEQMVSDLNFPVKVVPVATVREADGLALSSRNRRLSTEERRIAPVLYRSLEAGRERIAGGETRAAKVKEAVLRQLAEAPAVRVEYIEVVDAAMQPVAEITGAVRIAAAVWLGSTRLIDNVPCEPALAALAGSASQPHRMRE